MDDMHILQLYNNRDEQAIAQTAEKYGRYLEGISDNILHNASDVEECVNDTYLRAWYTIPPKKPDRFQAFLGRITRNLSFDRYRKNHAKKRAGDETAVMLCELEECLPAVGNTYTEWETGRIAALINKFLYAQSSVRRNIFIRRYWYCDAITQIAARYAYSESKVKSVLMRTRAALKAYLEKEGVEL